MAATRENVNAAMVFQFLYALVEVFNSYFGGRFEEDAVRDNFPLVYELLDEVMDFGYPQNCSADLLKTFIMQVRLSPLKGCCACFVATAGLHDDEAFAFPSPASRQLPTARVVT